MKNRNEHYLISLYWLLGLVFFGLSIAGGIRHYSPVPFGDMWLGYLDFFLHIDERGLEHWWSQHNEHRILLSRLFFWFDLAVLGGTTPFLQIVNYFLALSLWLVLCALAVGSMKDANAKNNVHYLMPLLLIPCFSLMQYENLYWGFQSQFYLVYLLPAIAFYSLSRAREESASIAWFWTACVMGILSLGSMANGVLALPILALQALLLRTKVWWFFVLAGLSCMGILLYFHGYNAVSGHGSLSTALLDRPMDLLRYLLLYLGSPFHHIVGNNHSLAQAMGLFLLASSVFFLFRVLTGKMTGNYPAALLAILLFIGGTALGTGGGRLLFGFEQALSYRYATPALLAWSALLILYVQHFSTALGKHPKLLILGIAIPLIALPSQLRFQHMNHHASSFEGKLAVLSLQMGVLDNVALQAIGIGTHPRWRLDDISKKMTKRSLSIFASPEMQRAAIPLGQTVNTSNTHDCQGYVDSTGPVIGDDHYIWIRGWLFDGSTNQTPEWINIADSQGRVIGYALPGQVRKDVANAVNPAALRSGFAGYIRKPSAEGPLIIRAEQPDCTMTFNVK